MRTLLLLVVLSLADPAHPKRVANVPVTDYAYAVRVDGPDVLVEVPS